MYLKFNTEEEANQRSKEEALKRGCVPPTIYWWSAPIQDINGNWFLDVGDGDGLSYLELSKCVETIEIEEQPTTQVLAPDTNGD
jgi:hypothetical protein